MPRSHSLLSLLLTLLLPATTLAGWKHLSTTSGDLPALPYSEGVSTLVFDVDRDGDNDFVIAGWNRPGMVWYRRSATGWELFVIEDTITTIEAGGDFFDIDGDGDLDIVQGSHQSGELWWWENPYPNYAANTPWKVRTIKSGGGKKHHDQIFGDFDGDGRTELVFWNNDVDTLFFAEIPADPRQAGEWPRSPILQLANAEGLAKADVDGDGVDDIVCAGRWLKHAGGTRFAVEIVDAGRTFTRAAAGQLVAGGRAEIVFGTGDKATGQLAWYEYAGGRWVPHVLQDPEEYGHTLQLADVNGDGHLDVFAAEVAHGDNNDAKVWVFYGDGKGAFTKETISTGVGVHEGRVGDLDGDGDLDIVGKNFRLDMPRLDIWLQDGTSTAPAPSLDAWHYVEVDDQRAERAFGLAFGDVNGDGRKDIASGPYVYLNPGGDLTGSWRRVTLPGGVDASLVVDVDGDDKLDVIAQRLPDLVWLEATDASASSWTSRVVGSVPPTSHGNSQGYTLARIAGGPKPQILIAGADGDGIYSFTVPQNPNETWPRQKIASGTSEEMIGVGDIDGDGDLDIAAGSSSGSNNIAFFENPGNGGANWTRHAIGTAINPQGIVVADFDGDGRADVAVTEETSSSVPDAKIYLFRQQAGGTWRRELVGVRYSSFGFDAADMDGDGDVDLISGENIVGGDDGQEQTIIWQNDGAGHFSPVVVDTGKESHLGSRAVDLDGDGDLDLVSIAWSTYRFLHLWRNDNGTVAPRPTADASVPRPDAGSPRPGEDGAGPPPAGVDASQPSDAGTTFSPDGTPHPAVDSASPSPWPDAGAGLHATTRSGLTGGCSAAPLHGAHSSQLVVMMVLMMFLFWTRR